MFLQAWRKNPRVSSILQAGLKPATGVAVRTSLWFLVPAILAIMSFRSLAANSILNKNVLFDIPQQRADIALIEFAKQADITLFFPFEDAMEVTANALQGQYSVREAVRLLLNNTPLKVKVGDDGQLTILAASSLGEIDTMINKKQLSSAIIGVMSSIAAAELAAQDNELTEPLMEEVVVTGSFLKRTNFDGAAPIQVLDRETFESTPVTSISDIIRNLPVSTGAQTSSELGVQVGTANINIRGLGAGSTLTLINGRRGGNSTASDINSNLYFDINQVPMAMIERIEILTDGASATYGAQAVAGVANIITRKGFEGFEIKLTGESSKQDRKGIDIVAGLRGDNSIFNVYLSASHKDRVERGEFDWYKDRLGTRLVSGTGAPGSYTRNDVAGGQRVPDAFCGFGGDGNETVTDSNYSNELGYLSGNRCRYSFFNQLSALQETNLLQTFSEFEWQFSEQLKFYGELGASHNVSKSSAGSSLFSVAPLIIPGSHPYNFYTANGATGLEYRGPDRDGNFAPGDAALWADGTLQAVELRATTRLLGQETQAFGSQYGTGSPGESRYALDYQRVVLGADMELTDNWDAGVSYVRSLASSTTEGPFSWIPNNVLSVLNNGTFNPFGTALLTPDLASPKQGVLADVTAANSRIVTDSLWTPSNSFRRTDTTVLEGIVTGNLFELGGGDAGVALGAQTRKEVYRSDLDSLSSTGSSGRGITAPAVSGQETSNAVFTELYLPVLDNLEVQLAARYEDFDVASVDTTVPKISARWQATDWLAVRASWGQSFQAPGIFQTATVVSSSILSDSVYLQSGGCSPAGPGDSQPSQIANIILQGSDDLEPQSADSMNFGIVLDPIENLRLGFEYWSYDYTDLITQGISAQTKVNNDCLDGVPNDPDIIRAAATVPGGVGILRDVGTEIVNVGSVKNDGVDLSFDYTMGSDIGEWNLAGTITYVNSFDIVEGLAGAKIDGVGSRNATNSFRTTPEWKGRVNVGWFGERQQTNVVINYIDGYDNDATITASFSDPTPVSSMTTVDLQYSYTFDGMFGGQSIFSAGARNLFDQEPPFLGPKGLQTTPSQRPGYDEFAHDPRGRAYFVSFKQKF